jgi:hypothetical protein
MLGKLLRRVFPDQWRRRSGLRGTNTAGNKSAGDKSRDEKKLPDCCVIRLVAHITVATGTVACRKRKNENTMDVIPTSGLL